MKKTAYFIILFVTIFAACQKESVIQADGSSGQGGSTARFAIVGNYLYTVNESQLQVFDISEPDSPVDLENEQIGWGIETIFPYGNKLFLGTQTGMLVYDVSNPASPEKISEFEHVYSCDPVVVEGDYAYLTIHSEGNWCGQFNNELQIINIKNIENPKLIGTYTMTSPLGLGVDGDLLFVCDKGLKVFDINDRNNIKLLQHFDISANDVIPYHDNLLVIGDVGLYQYSYSGDKLNLLSTLFVQK